MKNLIVKIFFVISLLSSVPTLGQWKELGYGTIQGWCNSVTEAGSNILAGTAWGGVYYSSDNGDNWMKANNGTMPGTINSVFYQNGKAFAGTINGLYVSTDFGVNWSLLGFLNSGVESIRSNGTTLYLVSQQILFASTNEGTSWLPISQGVSNGIRGFTHAGANSIVAYNDVNFLLTTDGGLTWTTSANPAGSVTSIFVTGTVYLAGSNTGIYRSIDSGLNWQKVSTVSGRFFIDFNGKLICGAHFGFYQSTDNGSSWVKTSDISGTFWDLTKTSTKIFAAASNLGIISSSNGIDWAISGKGLASPPAGNLIVTGGKWFSSSKGIFYSSNGGQNWTNRGFSSSFVQSMIIQSGISYAAVSGEGVYKSTDDGITWTLTNNGLLNLQTNSICSDGINVFVATNSGVYVSLNQGGSWSFSGFSGTLVSKLSSLGGVIFATTSNGRSTTGFYKSTNSGTSWQAIVGLPDVAVEKIAVSPNAIYAVINNGIFFSNDNGSSWKETNPVFRNMNVQSMYASLTDLFIAGDNKILKFTGNSIVNLSDNSPFIYSGNIADMTMNDSELLVAVTDYNNFGSIWSYPITNIVSISEFTPHEGKGGTTITINGQNFSPITSQNLVTFQNSFAEVKSATPTTLVVTIPRTFGSKPIQVKVNGKSASSTDNFSIVPSIDDIQPVRGIIGSFVTISGSGFDPVIQAVTLNGLNALQKINVTNNEISAVILEGAASGTIALNYNGKIYSSNKIFSVIPYIQEMRPSSGLVGTEVIINGSGFDRITTNNTVKFNGTLATVVSGNYSTLIVKVPSGNVTGRVTVEVANSLGVAPISFTLLPLQSNCFTTPAKPSIITLTNINDKTILKSSSRGGNQWFNGGVMIPGARDSVFSVTQPGIYSVQVTIEGCLSAMSDNVAANFITSIIETKDEILSVYPNPCGEELTIHYNYENRKASISIYNSIGQSIAIENNVRGFLKLNVARWPKGIYLVNACYDGQCQQKRIVKSD